MSDLLADSLYERCVEENTSMLHNTIHLSDL